MKTFRSVRFDLARARKEFGQLRSLLDGHASLEERKQILPFFQERLHLSLLCGLLGGNLSRVDLIAWEYDLFGDFACDLVVGNSVEKGFCFIEFEDAGPNSIFGKKGKKAQRDWSSRFEHGYSQVIDWYHKLDTMTDNPDYEARFGKRSIDYEGLLVVGRNQYLDPEERLRLEWRRRHVIVHSRAIRCFTFDELLSKLGERLDLFAQVVKPKGKGQA
jgi:hypothetical protein